MKLVFSILMSISSFALASTWAPASEVKTVKVCGVLEKQTNSYDLIDTIFTETNSSGATVNTYKVITTSRPADLQIVNMDLSQPKAACLLGTPGMSIAGKMRQFFALEID
jgi:hypothetical protein